MDRRNFSLLAVTAFLGLATSKSSSASSYHNIFKNKKKLTGAFKIHSSSNSLIGRDEWTDGNRDIPQESETRKGEGLLTFNEDGSGVGNLKSVKLKYDKQFPLEPYTEEILSDLEFFHEITKTGDILMHIKSNSWAGQIAEGPHRGKIFSVDPGQSLLAAPHFKGRLSEDGNTIEFMRIERHLVKIQVSDKAEILDALMPHIRWFSETISLKRQS
jgi:hypothetical protein